MKLLYIGDNRRSRNIGGRSTNISLLKIIAKLSSNIITLPHWHGEIDGRISDTEANEVLFKKQYEHDFINCEEMIKTCDAIVVSAEGNCLFTSPIRNELAYFLIVFKLCIKYNKPYCLVNAGISPPIDIESNGLKFLSPNKEILDECIRYFKKAALVVVREKLSFDFLKKYDIEGRINLHFVPDALFGLYDFYEQHSEIFDSSLKHPEFCIGHDRNESAVSKFDFEKPYVLLSGSAFVTRYGNENKAEQFAALAMALKKMLSSYSAKLYLIECCDGDSIFRFQVPTMTGIPYIPVNTNIFLLGRILSRCICFVSGRFHPSIFASFGGAKLILLGSDSHKIQGLPLLLDYPTEIHQAVPNTDEIALIVDEVKQCFTSPASRNTIKAVSRRNYELTMRYPDLILSSLRGV